jgi:hypothetical protein
MGEGYIKLHRKVLDSAIWQSPNDWRLACALLLKANWKPGVFQARNGDVVNVGRGELVTSLDSLKKASGLTIKNIRTSLHHLEKADFLASTSASHYRIIKVINYGKYQDHENEGGNDSGKDLARTGQGPGNDIRRLRREEGKKTTTTNAGAFDSLLAKANPKGLPGPELRVKWGEHRGRRIADLPISVCEHYAKDPRTSKQYRAAFLARIAQKLGEMTEGQRRASR